MAITEDKSTHKDLDLDRLDKVERPIVFKLFWAFLVSTTFTVAMVTFLILVAFNNISDLPPEAFDMFITKIVNQFLLLVLFVFIPSIFFAMLFAQGFSKPIQDIGRNIKEISKGNLNLSLSTKRKDELGNLVLMFNQMIEHLKNVREREKEVSQLKSRFITVASHQLRTPSTGITWGLQELLKGTDPLTDNQRKLLEQCQARNIEAIRIVDEMMTVVQVEEHQYNFVFQDIDMSGFLNKLVEEYKVEASFNQIDIIFDNKVTNHPKVLGDTEKLLVVFRNIIQNAIQYGSKGTNVEILMEKSGTNLLVHVTDYGMGIDKEDLDKIFIKFFRADNAVKLKPNGSGVGLFICKQIIDNHKGSISVKSGDIDGKTTFTVSLPLYKDIEEKSASIEELFKTI